MESQQHLLPFAGTSEKHLRPFKKGTVLSHHHSGSKIIELCRVTWSLTSDLRSPAAGCCTDSWLLQITVVPLACPRAHSMCKGVQKDPSILKTTQMTSLLPLVAQTVLDTICSFYADCCQLQMCASRQEWSLSCMMFLATGSKSKTVCIKHWPVDRGSSFVHV